VKSIRQRTDYIL